MAETRVGYWYATGPADKQYTPGDPDFNLQPSHRCQRQVSIRRARNRRECRRAAVPCPVLLD
jgi:hypothetical protein